MTIHVFPYVQDGKLVAYRLQKKLNSELAEQKYFFFKEYGGEPKAMAAAKKQAKCLNEKYRRADLLNSVFHSSGRLKGLGLYCDYREKYNEPVRYLRLQIAVNKKAHRKDWRLSKYDWQTAFEEAVKEIIAIRNLSLDRELAMRIEASRKFYDPSRKSNWK